MATRTKYTPAEDKALLNFVAQYQSRYPATANKLWILAEAQKITNHSWQSMKARYQLLSGASAKKGKKKPSFTKKAKPNNQRPLPFASTTSTRSTLHVHVHIYIDVHIHPPHIHIHSPHIHIHSPHNYRQLNTDRQYGDGERRGRHPPVLSCDAVQASGCRHPDITATIPQTIPLMFLLETSTYPQLTLTDEGASILRNSAELMEAQTMTFFI